MEKYTALSIDVLIIKLFVIRHMPNQANYIYKYRQLLAYYSHTYTFS